MSRDETAIGWVEIAYDDDSARATFHVGGTWTFEGDEIVASILRGRTYLIDTSTYSPSQGEYGYAYLNQLADHFGVKPTFIPKPGPPPGTVY